MLYLQHYISILLLTTCLSSFSQYSDSTSTAIEEESSTEDAGQEESQAATNYFILRSAIPMKKKSKVYNNSLILLDNSIDYAVTDKFSLGGGLTLIFPNISAKFSGRIANNTYLGAATKVIIAYTGDDTNILSTIYSVVTFGKLKNNLSVNGGIIRSDSQVTYNSNSATSPFVAVNWKFKVGKGFYLMADNAAVFVDGKVGFGSLVGTRIYIHKNKVALNIAIPVTKGDNEVSLGLLGGGAPVVPYVGITVAW